MVENTWLKLAAIQSPFIFGKATEIFRLANKSYSLLQILTVKMLEVVMHQTLGSGF